MASGLRRARAFPFDKSGVAIIEFAMVAPFLLLLLLAGFDMGRYALATQRVEAVANSVAQMLSQTGLSSDAVNANDGTVTDTELNLFRQSALFTFPEALAAASRQGVKWSDLLVVNMASIRFRPPAPNCATHCAYTPQVVWSTGWRSCVNPISQGQNTDTPTATTLPVGVYGPGSQIVVDVQYTFTPTFGAAYLPSLPIVRSAFLSPRNVGIVETTQSAIAPTCTGALP